MNRRQFFKVIPFAAITAIAPNLLKYTSTDNKEDTDSFQGHHHYYPGGINGEPITGTYGKPYLKKDYPELCEAVYDRK